MHRGGLPMRDDVIYLAPLTRAIEHRRHPLTGTMVTPHSDYDALLDWVWAADNHCFSAGDRFDRDAYLAWLAAPRRPKERCLFAVAGPDVVGDAERTWTQSAPMLAEIRALGYPAAYVAQDGLDAATIDWSAFDVLFIGGTTRWKRSEAGGWAAIREARRRGKRVHVGKVNAAAYITTLTLAGVDSADGTWVIRNPNGMMALFERTLDRLTAQLPLELVS